MNGVEAPLFRAVEADCIALRDAAGRENGAAARARLGESLTDELFAEVALLHVLFEPEFADRAHTAAAGDNADRTDDIAAVHHIEMPRFARSTFNARWKAGKVKSEKPTER